MRPWIGSLYVLLLLVSPLAAQTSTYHDVAVIINSNSPQSDSIGTYFAACRDIHSENIIRIPLPLTEEISDAQFCDLRSKVESHLMLYGIMDSISYLVTTKGVPLKVKRQDGWFSSSVESELALILGPHSGAIGLSGRMVSPYYGKRTHFTRAEYGIYLVTRLDGYTVADVKGIIDRSSVIHPGLPDSGQFVLDMDPGWNAAAGYLNTRMKTASDTMQRRGLAYLLDTSMVYMTGCREVNGYVGWGSNDKHTSQYGRLGFTWRPGAIAETYVSTSARTFTRPVVYGQSLIADIIAEGCTAAKGYVYEPYASAMADVSVLFDLYTKGFTVAESFYSSSPFLSWMDVVIGDPKYRLTAERLPNDAHPAGSELDGNGLPVELTSFTARRSSSGIQLSWTTATETDNYGFDIERKMTPSIVNDPMNQSFTGSIPRWTSIAFVPGHGTINTPQSYHFHDPVDPSASRVYRLRQIDRSGVHRYSAEITVGSSSAPATFGLEQNYPNPFNPVSSIQYHIPVSGVVSLKVYDILGKEVSVLVHGIRPAGESTVQFDASSLPSGIYFYTLRIDSYSQTRKMMYLK